MRLVPSGDPRGRQPQRGEVGSSGVASKVEHFFGSAARGALRSRPLGLRFWDGSELPATEDANAATVVIRDPVALAYALREPNQLGLGRAWVAGVLDVDGDLEQALALRSRFRGVSLTLRDRLHAAILARHLAGRVAFRRPPALASEARLGGRLHSLRRDSAAVRHHYDAPESLYRLILGPSMVYSCAYFRSADDSLEHAQERKLELICRKLRLRPGDRLLDIGCGWGTLLLHAAEHHGVRAVGVTLSPAQGAAARDRIRGAGAGENCEVRIADYREIDDGPYDAIASVGMYEHVGRERLGEYVNSAAGLLRPGGLFLNHGIVRLTAGPRHRRTFINHFVFPDGELHDLTEILLVMQASGFEIWDIESLREHYVLTLRRWLENLNADRQAAIREAGAERERIWRLYMTGSARAFDDGEISVFQTLAAKPGAPHRLPLTRGDLHPA